MKKSVILLFICILIAGLVMNRQKKRTQVNSTEKLTPVRLALDWVPNTDHTGLYVALSKGWYKEEGIDLQILPFSSDVSSSTLLLSRKADIGIGSIEDVVGNAAKNTPLISIAAVLQHNTSGFLVLKSSKISRPKELDGKVYGGYGSPFESAVVASIIKKDGGKGNFKNIVLDVKAMEALESKRIDFVWALAGWEVVQAKKDGFETHFFPLTKYGIADSPTLVFLATPEKIQENNELFKKFMKATIKGYEYARANPKDSAQILIDSTPKGTFPDPQLVYESQEIVSKEYADEGRVWGKQDQSMWEGYPQFMLDSGAIVDETGKVVKSIDPKKLYTNGLLP